MNITKSRSFQNSNRVMETGKKISRGQIQRVKKERIEWDNIGRSNNQKFLHNINPNVSVTWASKQMWGVGNKHQYEDILKVTREGGNHHECESDWHKSKCRRKMVTWSTQKTKQNPKVSTYSLKDFYPSKIMQAKMLNSKIR